MPELFRVAVLDAKRYIILGLPLVPAMKISIFVLFFAFWLNLIVVDSSLAKSESKEDLPNFHKVHSYLYRGGEPSEPGLYKLKDMGIATIIDLRGSYKHTHPEESLANKLGINYINLPMSDKAPTNEQVKTLINTIESARDDKNKGPVFVHCAHGSDRTGCMIGIWRVVEDGWTYENAYKEMRKYWFTPKFTKLSGTVRKYSKS
jgi:protein tyrosine/serine phosphatase